MFEFKKSHLILFIALSIASIGAFGQAYLLYHELVNCLPYKEMHSTLYTTIATIGICIAPLIAVIGGLFFGIRKFWLGLIVPVISCPILFAIIYKLTTFILTRGVAEENWSFYAKNKIVAAQDFYFYTLSLAVTGLAIGGICSLLLFYLSKEKKLA